MRTLARALIAVVLAGLCSVAGASCCGAAACGPPSFHASGPIALPLGDPEPELEIEICFDGVCSSFSLGWADGEPSCDGSMGCYLVADAGSVTLELAGGGAPTTPGVEVYIRVTHPATGATLLDVTTAIPEPAQGPCGPACGSLTTWGG